MKTAVWVIVSLVGAAALGVLALHRGETINAVWVLAAALCTYAIGYRFYSRLIATRLLKPGRATRPLRRLLLRQILEKFPITHQPLPIR